MLPVVLAAVVLFVVMGGVAFLAIKTSLTAKKDEEVAIQQPRQQAAVAPRQAAPAGGRQAALDRMRAGMRQRLAARQAEEAGGQAAETANDDSDNGTASYSGSEDEAGDGPLDRRAARRAARREAAAAQQAAYDARLNKRSAYEERRAKREAEREAQEAAQEEEMRRAAEERARREEAEAAKWMGQIVLEEQGEEGDESGASAESLLAQFVAYIRSRKTVPLEALALEFGMRTSDVIDRIRALEAAGRLTGVMDERGKYIYISLDEMNAVASYIRSRGRVAIGELAARSSSLIDLESKAEATAPGAAGAGAAGPTLDFDQLLAVA
ncbi:hypothetical protein Vretifemale_14722 [Volvox reticuliferus]|uniref:DDRGK domain-containing protein 1 n=3 Tax=Volvox reticuliferus TaxID=1737510 RepID=A0A8J4FTL4_9CHLO|nr:hypothetical protein Vretifemale_14722 [Volvox reticuliferus]